MKKLLSILGIVSLTGIGVNNVIACHSHKEEKLEDIVNNLIKKIDNMFKNPEIKKKIIENDGKSKWDKYKNDWDIQKKNFSKIDFSTFSEQEKNCLLMHSKVWKIYLIFI